MGKTKIEKIEELLALLDICVFDNQGRHRNLEYIISELADIRPKLSIEEVAHFIELFDAILLSDD